jgi:preprotein translocase subunit SecY
MKNRFSIYAFLLIVFSVILGFSYVQLGVKPQAISEKIIVNSLKVNSLKESESVQIEKAKELSRQIDLLVYKYDSSLVIIVKDLKGEDLQKKLNEIFN